MRRVSWEELPYCDLEVGEVYCRGAVGKGVQNEVLHRLLPGVSNSGGIRAVGGWQTSGLCVLFSTDKEPQWPDRKEVKFGSYLYFGDNKTPGKKILDTPRKGNALLNRTFHRAQEGQEGRLDIPVFLIFTAFHKSGEGVVFEGIGVPSLDDEGGGLEVVTENLGTEIYENYLARFNLLEERVVSRTWINQLLTAPAKAKADRSCPRELNNWIQGRPHRLLSPIGK